MLISTINAHIATAPVLNLQKHIQSMSLTTSFDEFLKAEAAATAYLNCLNDTRYITARENFEYQRQIRDERNRKLEVLTR